MLQRAATNAYSWWWASHVRTKQSKWLEQSLQDMEEKVKNVLKLIEEDGDSFAKRAEMYYKKRPELIHFVEEAYRAFRALAERYDHLSTDLQNANNTIASVFPEQVQLHMDDDDENIPPKFKKNLPHVTPPNVPKAPTKDFKGLLQTVTKQLKPKASETAATKKSIVKSGLSKSEALDEIDRLQKQILALQTAKEFEKSSYESRLEKYWAIDNQIAELQQKVFTLQDEFKVGRVIENNEARNLMAETALKSCQEALAQLQEMQEKSSEESIVELQRIEEARQRLKNVKFQYFPDQASNDGADMNSGNDTAREISQSSETELNEAADKEKELNNLKQKIKESLEAASSGELTMSVMADKIDELVNKVIDLEDAVSSQAVLLSRLRTENDDLQVQIRSLEDGKASLSADENLQSRLQEVEEKLCGVQDLKMNVEKHNDNLQAHFTEAHCSLDHLSDKLHTVMPDEEKKEDKSLGNEMLIPVVAEPKDDSKKIKAPSNFDNDDSNSNASRTVEAEVMQKGQLLTTSYNPVAVDKEADGKMGRSTNSMLIDKVAEKNALPMEGESSKPLLQEKETDKDRDLQWRLMLLSGLEDREKVLLTEYNSVLKCYKDAKVKLSEAEKNNRDALFDFTVQIRDLKGAIAKRDEEIASLSKRLKLLQESMNCLPEPLPQAEDLAANKDLEPTTEEHEEEVKLIVNDQPQITSPVEEKLRMNIDAILDENLDFWLRFSTAFHQIQTFKSGVKDLKDELAELKKNSEKTTESDLRSDVRPIYKHLREIETELTLWKERSAMLKEELNRRFSSLCKIQDDITMALKEGVEEEEIKFTSHQATKFQGEVLNMKQENNKVSEELEAGLYHVTSLQLEIEKTLASLDKEFGFSEPKDRIQPQSTEPGSHTRVPLQSFIFGTKPKKHRTSLFSLVHPRLHKSTRL